MSRLQIGLKKKTAAGAAAAAKEAEEHAKEAEKGSSNHVQRKLKARNQSHKLDEVSAEKQGCRPLEASWCEYLQHGSLQHCRWLPSALNMSLWRCAPLHHASAERRRHHTGARPAVCWRKATGSHLI